MAINVYLQDINGTKQAQVYDLYGSLSKLWPVGDSRFPLLQYIDPYGNVIFNGAQMDQVIADLNRLMGLASTGEQKSVIAAVIDLAINCQSDPHTYLRFRGD